MPAEAKKVHPLFLLALFVGAAFVGAFAAQFSANELRTLVLKRETDRNVLPVVRCANPHCGCRNPFRLPSGAVLPEASK